MQAAASIKAPSLRGQSNHLIAMLFDADMNRPAGSELCSGKLQAVLLAAQLLSRRRALLKVGVRGAWRRRRVGEHAGTKREVEQFNQKAVQLLWLLLGSAAALAEVRGDAAALQGAVPGRGNGKNWPRRPAAAQRSFTTQASSPAGEPDRRPRSRAASGSRKNSLNICTLHLLRLPPPPAITLNPPTCEPAQLGSECLQISRSLATASPTLCTPGSQRRGSKNRNNRATDKSLKKFVHTVIVLQLRPRGPGVCQDPPGSTPNGLV